MHRRPPELVPLRPPAATSSAKDGVDEASGRRLIAPCLGTSGLLFAAKLLTTGFCPRQAFAPRLCFIARTHGTLPCIGLPLMPDDGIDDFAAGTQGRMRGE
jgi:hypothetical protein